MQYILTEEEYAQVRDNREVIRREERADLKKRHDAMLVAWRETMTDLFRRYLVPGQNGHALYGEQSLYGSEIRQLVKLIGVASGKLKLPE